MPRHRPGKPAPPRRKVVPPAVPEAAADKPKTPQPGQTAEQAAEADRLQAEIERIVRAAYT